jgi:hypothetical protein
MLRRFFAHRSVELLLSGLVGVLKQQDSNSSDVIPGFAFAWNCRPLKNSARSDRSHLREAIAIIVGCAESRLSQKNVPAGHG